jgi:hypothetical protein
LFGRDGEFSGACKVVRDFFAQRRDAARGAVTIAAGRDRVAERIDNRSRGMEIGLAKLEMNDGAALTLKFPGARKDGQRTFAVQL